MTKVKALTNGHLKKPQLNFSCPQELIEAYNELAAPLNKKQKWMVGVAGLLVLLELPQEVLEARIGMVGAADPSGKWKELVAAAKRAASSRSTSTERLIADEVEDEADLTRGELPPTVSRPKHRKRLKGNRS